MKIYASKNYSYLSYMTGSEVNLYNIIEDEVIYTSEEPGFSGRFVCLSKDLTSPARRNPSRWSCGVILDGAKLTDKYRIEPYSYAYHAYDSNKRVLVVKSITLYDTGECTLTLINHPTKLIPRKLYDKLKDLIVSDVQHINDKKRLKRNVGKRRRLGRMIVEQYLYDVPSGGISLNPSSLPAEYAQLLVHHTNLNETEERLQTSDSLIDIHNCIVEVLFPANRQMSDELADLCNERNLEITFF